MSKRQLFGINIVFCVINAGLAIYRFSYGSDTAGTIHAVCAIYNAFSAHCAANL